MPESGEYLFTNASFFDKKPILSFQDKTSFHVLAPLSYTLTLQFDMRQRYCIGWRDITIGEQFVCSDHQTVSSKYEQCAACQQRTGFNPAFYYASSISKQQEARNLTPHILYLAHFGAGVIKVGISYAARHYARLLEQGARSALVLDIFPTALIARQHEARIATLADIAETIQLRKKSTLLAQPYDQEAAERDLQQTRARIEQALATSFTQNAILTFDTIYFPSSDQPQLSEAYDCTDQHLISGKVTGMLGSLLFCKQQDTSVFLALKKHIGYKLTLSYEDTPIKLPAQQTSLF